MTSIQYIKEIESHKSRKIEFARSLAPLPIEPNSYSSKPKYAATGSPYSYYSFAPPPPPPPASSAMPNDS